MILGGSRILRLYSAYITSRLNLILGYSSVFNTSWVLIALANLDSLFLVFSCYGLSLAAVVGSQSGALGLGQEGISALSS